jgi:hypothetical protein
MAGLDPAIHDLLSIRKKTWMPGTTPGMTRLLMRLIPIVRRAGLDL